jgi:hypothetical protein
MFLSPTTHVAARIWTPCVDSLWERCTWELEFTVPSVIPDRTDLPPNLVVSSGELMEQVSYRPQFLRSKLTFLDHTPTQSQQDDLLLHPSQPDIRPAHPLCGRTIRDAAHPPRGEEGDRRLLPTGRREYYGQLDCHHVQSHVVLLYRIRCVPLFRLQDGFRRRPPVRSRSRSNHVAILV